MASVLWPEELLSQNFTFSILLCVFPLACVLECTYFTNFMSHTNAIKPLLATKGKTYSEYLVGMPAVFCILCLRKWELPFWPATTENPSATIDCPYQFDGLGKFPGWFWLQILFLLNSRMPSECGTEWSCVLIRNCWRDWVSNVSKVRMVMFLTTI